MTPVFSIPDHLRAELDRLGVRTPTQTKQPKRDPSDTPDQWWKRDEECPF